ncbi:hypothetical protein CCR75_006812 [Bremia lactucae]|uniref:Uncharacterized protein n=1 Tax=Bremia lactucae TaxID=4779 RepID=A0A976IBU5_BRELC|nr:hypothetical protein CCR75_006812 [Bremia lactucae]
MKGRRRALLRAHAFVSLARLVMASDTSKFCSSIVSCLKDGSATCDTKTGTCPPCIYTLDSTHTCWEKDNSTNTCPFTGVRYDCCTSDRHILQYSISYKAMPDSWSVQTFSLNSSETSTTSSSSAGVNDPTSSIPLSPVISAETSSSISVGGLSPELVTYGAIGLGLVLIIVVIISIICFRRCKLRQRREKNVLDTANARGNYDVSDKRMRGLSKRDSGFSGPYNNILDTSKVSYAASSVSLGFSGHSKGSRPEPTDSSSHVSTKVSSRSFDGILAESAQSPAVLGGSVCGSHKSGSCRVLGSAALGGYGDFSNVNEYVQQDVSSRCSSKPNVFGEYLRMKEEMQYDEPDRVSLDGPSGVSFSDTISDLDSGKYSFHSVQGISRPPQRLVDQNGRSSIADSITDSEYAEQSLSRDESDCGSEMSFNDEKYSFSSIDSLNDSQVRESKREVEI